MKTHEIIIAVVIVAVAVFYFGFKYAEYSEEKQIELENSIRSEAFGTFMNELFILGSQCTTIPITNNNNTINLIAIECLNQGGSE